MSAPAPAGAGRARADGDIGHFITFGLLIAALVAVVAAEDGIVRWFVGPPPRELQPMTNAALVREFCCRPDPSIEEIEPFVDGWAFGPGEDVSDRQLETIAAATGQYVRSLDRTQDRLGALGKLAGLVLLGAIASRVAYRWRDMFIVLIPLYGPVFLLQMAWRITSPVRYWELPPRPPTTRRYLVHLIASAFLLAAWSTLGWYLSDALSPG